MKLWPCVCVACQCLYMFVFVCVRVGRCVCLVVCPCLCVCVCVSLCVCVCVCLCGIPECVWGDRGLMINIQMYHDVSPRLWECNLTEKSCSYLASALTSHSSSLTQLDLGDNNLLGDSGVELL